MINDVINAMIQYGKIFLNRILNAARTGIAQNGWIRFVDRSPMVNAFKTYVRETPISAAAGIM